MTRKRLREELALAEQRLRLANEEIAWLRRILEARTDVLDCEAWHHRAAGVEAKTVVESMRRGA